MKIAPVSITEVLMVGGLCIGGYLIYKTVSDVSTVISELPSPAQAASNVANYVADRNAQAVANANAYAAEKSTERTAAQNWVADTVQKGQDAGATTFLGSFWRGMFQ